MITFDTREEWDEFFDTEFPDGALVTFVLTSEEAVPYDQSPQDLVAKFSIFDMENGTPTVSFFSLYTDRHFLVPMLGLHERPYGFLMETVEDEAPSLMLSKQLSEEQQQVIKSVQEGGDE